MKIRTLLTAIAILFSQAAWPDDFEDGVAAYNRQDYTTALAKFQRAAEQGISDAQYNLGVMYERGRGIAQDDKQAVRWYTLAAQQGFVEAQYNLGLMYGFGRGVLQDHIRAHMWFNIAAGSGEKDSVKNINIAERKMTPQEIAEAQRMARECINSNFKKCD